MLWPMFNFNFHDIPKFMRTAKRYKVEIECCGDITTAKLIVDGKEVKSTTAKKHPEDKFSLRTGMETAFGRLWEKTEKKESDPAPAATESTKTKLKFKTGDRIIYVNPEDSHFDRIKGYHGRIVKTKESAYCGVYDYGVEFDNSLREIEVYCNECDGDAKSGHGLYVYEDAIIPEPTKEEIKLRFKVGDRVIYIKPEYVGRHFTGKHGRIVKVGLGCAPYDYGVEFDEPAGRCEFAHNCMGLAKTSHGLWVYDDALTPEPPKEEIKPYRTSPATGNPLRFHVGDRVVMESPEPLFQPIKGWCGTIIRVEKTPPYDYRVLFDDCIVGHGFYVDRVPCIPEDKPGHCLWAYDDWLKPEPKTT